jgi:intracellular sulfur oxidation DsrE/DsrF family protein
MQKLLYVLFILSFFIVKGQVIATKTGPIINNFGAVFKIDKPDLNLQNDREYKVIFDIYTDNSNGKKVNPLLNAVARFLNMHAQHQLLMSNIKVAVIMHGAAARHALNNDAYKLKFNVDNPNDDIITALKNANVDIFVCGQSYLSKGFKIKDKSKNVKLALSAMTALVEYQSNGYQVINFN